MDFHPPTDIVEARPFPVSATVTVDPAQVVQNLNGVAQLRPGQLLITIDKMELDLAPDGKDFRATLADGNQPARPINALLGSATWRWDVTAQHHGTHNLALFAYMFVTERDGTQTRLSASFDQPLADPSINVARNPAYEAGGILTWLSAHWPPLAAGGALIGFHRCVCASPEAPELN